MFLEHFTDYHWTDIWGRWWQSQHTELYVVFLKAKLEASLQYRHIHLLKEMIKQYCFHEGVHVVHINLDKGCMCHSNININLNGRTGFSTEVSICFVFCCLSDSGLQENSLSREIQMFFCQTTSPNSSRGTVRRSQAS